MANLPIVGPAYRSSSLVIDCQNTINWYPQAIESANGSRISALIPTPGLVRKFLGDPAPVRALQVLSTGALLAVIGKKLYHSKAGKLNLIQVAGTISGLGLVSIADNGSVAMIVNGSTTQVLDLTALTLTTLHGSNIPRSSFVVFLDGRFVMNKEKSDRLVWTDLYSTDINALSYATAEASPDPMIAMVRFQREIWMFGTQTVERYYSSADPDLPFVRVPGGVLEVGCIAPHSIAKFGAGVAWLSVSEFGGGQIVMGGGDLPQRISNHAIETEISSYPTLSDAVAYAYQQDGHTFYMISFPSGNSTFVFDATTQLWHQRSWTNRQGQHDRHRAHVHAFFNETHYVGDYSNGKIYALDPATFTDDGDLITRERTCPVTETGGLMSRFNRLEIVCETGEVRQKRAAGFLDIKFYTSQMYPYVFGDSLTLSAASTRLSKSSYKYLENLSVGASVSGISLPTVVTYGTYNAPAENLSVAASITGISLPTVVTYGIYNIPSEILNIVASTIDIRMPTVASYATFAIPSENLTMNAATTGVRLT